MSDRCSKCLRLMPEEDVSPCLCRKCAKARIEALEADALAWVAQRDEIMDARGRVIVSQHEEIQRLKTEQASIAACLSTAEAELERLRKAQEAPSK